MRIKASDLNDQAPQSYPEYRSALESAVNEAQIIDARLQAIEQEANGLKQRRAWLQMTIQSLRPLCDAESLADAAPQIGVVCYNALLNLQRPATAPEIRDAVKPYIDLGRYPNPLAVIHMALKRMNGVECFKTAGKTFYQVTPSGLPAY